MKSIVYVVRNGFYPPFNGERVKAATLATALAECGKLTVIDLGRSNYPGRQFPLGDELSLPYGGNASFYSAIRVEHPLLALKQALGLQRGEPAALERWNPGRRRAAAKLICRLKPDVVVVDHPLLVNLALRSGASQRIVHTHNLESVLTRATAAATGRLKHRLKVKRTERVERKLLPRCEQVWGVRESDLEAYRKLGIRQAVLIPNVIPDASFARQIAPGEPGHIFYFGWLAYPPNAEALDYLLDYCKRRAARGLPVRLTVVGRDAPDHVTAQAAGLGWLRLHGFVDSLLDFASHAAAIVIPLPWGGGTKLKVAEALALGKPLVTTPCGAEGLNIRDAVHAFVRPLGPSFDEAVDPVLAAPSAHMDMAKCGQLHAAQHFSQTALSKAVRNALSNGP